MTYPPQQGSGAYGHPAPHAQQPQQPYPPQPGYGYPQQQQQPYPQQPQPGYGHPQQQGQPYPPQQQWGAPPPPAPSSSGGGLGAKTILKIIVAVIALIVFAIVYFMSQDDADKAEAGDCMKNSGSTASADLEVVDCGDSKAAYKVVEVLPNTTDTTRCEGKSDASYVEQTRGGRRSSGTRFVLCLNEIKK
ncbi:hypothetical protein ACFYRC_16065 [Streptomyces sp. NPDC005279]|uniref:LppU/SCO3897 family protein n=1 Tax=Streptomyces sp. NPDC005279 TaxID=3364712 RepID=UPI0036A2E233